MKSLNANCFGVFTSASHCTAISRIFSCTYDICFTAHLCLVCLINGTASWLLIAAYVIFYQHFVDKHMSSSCSDICVVANESTLPKLSAAQCTKLRHLTIVTLAIKNKVCRNSCLLSS